MERGKQWVSHAVSITVPLKHCRDVLSYLKMWTQEQTLSKTQQPSHYYKLNQSDSLRAKGDLLKTQILPSC